jgi:hypothetical protein
MRFAMRSASKAELNAINEKLGTSRKPIRRSFVVVSVSIMALIRNRPGCQCHRPERPDTLVMDLPGA